MKDIPKSTPTKKKRKVGKRAVTQKNNELITSILNNNSAFEKLSRGGLPIQFLADQSLTPRTHRNFMRKNIEYYDRFSIAITKCLAAWQAIYHNTIFGTVVTPEISPETICAYSDDEEAELITDERPKKMDKVQTLIIEKAIAEIERYVPELSKIDEEMDPDSISGINIHFVKSTKVYD